VGNKLQNNESDSLEVIIDCTASDDVLRTLKFSKEVKGEDLSEA
jgi:hypothetical protein